MKTLPQLKIAHMTPKVPIVQGGMGVSISLSNLASAVARAGGIGTISGTGIPIEEMVYHIRRARELSNGQGYIGVNVLFAMSSFKDTVVTAMKEKVDFIVSGAGFSRDVYNWGREYDVPVIAVVSSAKFASLAERMGASAVVVEGSDAGGHLGTDRSVFEILPEVADAVSIPIIAAGGILHGSDLKKAVELGASAVQMGTRFVASDECDVSDAFKQRYLDATSDDTVLVKTTVGMQGRAIRNTLTDKLVAAERLRIAKCYNCLKSCNHQFCTLDTLIESAAGDIENGLVFAGSRVGEIKEILPVQEIIERFIREYENSLTTSDLNLQYTKGVI